MWLHRVLFRNGWVRLYSRMPVGFTELEKLVNLHCCCPSSVWAGAISCSFAFASHEGRRVKETNQDAWSCHPRYTCNCNWSYERFSGALFHAHMEVAGREWRPARYEIFLKIVYSASLMHDPETSIALDGCETVIIVSNLWSNIFWKCLTQKCRTIHEKLFSEAQQSRVGAIDSNCWGEKLYSL